MNYSRPNLFPFPMTGVTAAPDWKTGGSTVTGYAVSGDRERLLRWLTNLRDLTITVSWNVDYTFPPSPTIFNSNFNHTIVCSAPGLTAATSGGFYYSATSGGPPGPVWVDPGARVLAVPDGVKPLPSTSIGYPGGQSLNVEFRPSFDGTNFGVACQISAYDPATLISSTVPSAGGTVLGDALLEIDGMEFDMSLSINFGGAVSVLSLDYSITGIPTFY
jgi:hypothetical protein